MEELRRLESNVNGCSIAVIGATGAVGTVFLSILEERSFPAREVRLCASERSWGRKLTVLGEERTVEEATPDLLADVDLVFVCAGSGVSREIGPLAVEAAPSSWTRARHSGWTRACPS